MYAQCEDILEQSRILAELKILFPTLPHWRLRELCKVNSWHLDSCIEVMNVVVSNSNDVKNLEAIPNKIDDENRKNVERIGSLIRKGYRVMVLMRGPPGVGKSYMCRFLVNNFADFNNNYSIGDFICSSDDYFYNAKGVYKYNPSAISEAHAFNHRRVKEKAKSGLSPLIVDNTNMQLWEMLPYVKFGVENNYFIEILEPKTPWCNSPSSLAEKNKHGVPKNRIQDILAKYEKGTADSLIRMLKNVKYNKTLPQMRLLPTLNTATINSERVQIIDNSIPKNQLLEHIESQVLNDQFLEQIQSQVLNDIVPLESKEQRTRFKSNRSPTKSYDQQDCSASSQRNVYNLLEKKATNAWKPFEIESVDFWGIKSSKQQGNIFQLKELRERRGSENSLLDLLREDSQEATNELRTSLQDKATKTKGQNSFERHSINCPNENTAFISLRQIYPNKRVSDLWDLFLKCNGDIDWAVDILLKENELERIRGDEDIIYQSENCEIFGCLCNNIEREVITSDHKTNSIPKLNIKSKLNTSDAKPQRQKRERFSRSKQCTNPVLVEVKENIENCFLLRDDLYSQRMLKFRNIRSGMNDVAASLNAMNANCENIEESLLVTDNIYENIEIEESIVEGDNVSDDFSDDMLEMSLGEQLIKQLVDIFRTEASIEEQISSTLPPNIKVFMPRSLAKQLYMLWVESVYNYMEDERQILLREDENFARLLKNPKYSEFKESPNNLQEILDMEYAWKIYNHDKEEQKQQDIEIEKLRMPNDLASHLTQMKLCDTFPDIPRETLLDILVTNGNDYNTTVEVLSSTMQMENISKQNHLMECVLQEQDVVNNQIQNQIDKQVKLERHWDENDQKSILFPDDEAKSLALREFEESRNQAAHHCQLKAECYQKTKEAIQSGNGGAAIYYSQVANLHIKKIDMYNHRAANCIIDVHKNTQNNPDLLDLHYLYLIEALGCLDIFLDRHITGLRAVSRNYKYVFIITGRGKHSAGGVSTIKNKVKARLKERCLRWSEVNPGLLKVKIFSGSRHSKNI